MNYGGKFRLCGLDQAKQQDHLCAQNLQLVGLPRHAYLVDVGGGLRAADEAFAAVRVNPAVGAGSVLVT